LFNCGAGLKPADVFYVQNKIHYKTKEAGFI